MCKYVRNSRFRVYNPPNWTVNTAIETIWGWDHSSRWSQLETLEPQAWTQPENPVMADGRSTFSLTQTTKPLGVTEICGETNKPTQALWREERSLCGCNATATVAEKIRFEPSLCSVTTEGSEEAAASHFCFLLKYKSMTVSRSEWMSLESFCWKLG